MGVVHNLHDMFLFAKVVEHGGYSAAAVALGMQASKLSRHIVKLEQQLDVRLLNRTTRRVSLTEAGQTFYGHCAAVVAEAQAARDAIDLTRSAPQGLVRISCPLGLLQGGVRQVVADYLADYPLVRVAVDATNRRVEVIEERLDIALRVRRPPLDDSDLAVRVLGTSTPLLVASPGLLAQLPSPGGPDEVASLPTLAMIRADSKHVWELLAPDGSAVAIRHTPRLLTDDLPALRLAALAGLGVTQLPRGLVQAELDAGRLLPVLPAYRPIDLLVHAVFPSRRGQVPAVRGLLEALVRAFADGRCLA